MWVGEIMSLQAERIFKELTYCTHLRELKLDLQVWWYLIRLIVFKQVRVIPACVYQLSHTHNVISKLLFCANVMKLMPYGQVKHNCIASFQVPAWTKQTAKATFTIWIGHTYLITLLTLLIQDAKSCS